MPDTSDTPGGRLAAPIAALATVLVLAAVVAVVGWRVTRRAGASPPKPQPRPPVVITGAPPIPEFTLTERSGKTVTRADLEGKVWVVGFIFTRCPTSCPIITAAMKQLSTQITDPDVRFLSISVDPEWDDPEVLRAYADDYEADPDRWWFVTGAKQAIYDLVQGGFKLALKEVPGPERVIHSNRLALVDRTGVVRGYTSGNAPEALAGLVQRVAELLAEK